MATPEKVDVWVGLDVGKDEHFAEVPPAADNTNRPPKTCPVVSCHPPATVLDVGGDTGVHPHRLCRQPHTAVVDNATVPVHVRQCCRS
ncbi:MAG: hypothetical protein ACXV5Q_11975 [Frankiaceae bacterium]